jgi:hypothetical protein
MSNSVSNVKKIKGEVFKSEFNNPSKTFRKTGSCQKKKGDDNVTARKQIWAENENDRNTFI